MPEAQTEFDKAEVERRAEKGALQALANLYHAITGKDCERYNAIGMATSAVSSLMADNASIRSANRALLAVVDELRTAVMSTRDEALEEAAQMAERDFAPSNVAADIRALKGTTK